MNWALKTQTMKWMLTPLPPTGQVEKLAQETGLSSSIAGIMINRGMDTPDKVNQFLHPSLDKLEDPFSLLGMRQGVDRV